MGLVAPFEAVVDDSVSECEEGMESVGMEGVARRERAGHVSAGALVSEDPEVELGEEAREVGESGVWR